MIAIAIAVAAPVRVEVPGDFLSGISLHTHVEIVEPGPFHDRPAARQPVIQHAGAINPESGQPPVAQGLELRERLNLPIVAVAVEVVLLLPARDEVQLPVPLGRLRPDWEDV